MLTLVLLAVAAQAPAADRPRLVVQDIVPGKGVDPAVAQSLSASLAKELQRRGVHDVVTAQDIAALLGQERQKQLLGCGDEATSCLAELAGALNARLLVSGALVRLGSAWQLTLQTVDTQSSRSTGRAVRMAREPEELVVGWGFTVAEAVGLPAPAQPTRIAPALLLGSGAAAAVGGGVVLLQSVFREGELTTELRLAAGNPAVLRPAAAYEADAASLVTQRWIGAGLVAAGVVLAAAGTLWLSLGGESRPALAALVAPGGGLLVLSGRLP